MASTPSKESMSKTRSKFALKRWVWVPLALILVLATILSQIDLEAVKENLIEKVSSETGLKVEVDSIGFGFSRGLGLQCKGVKVSTPEGDQYSVDRLDLLAAWSPLLRGEFQIKSASLQHPVIKLELPEPAPEQTPPAKKEETLPDKSQPSDGLIDAETLESTTVKLESNPLSIDKFVVSDGQITLTRPGSTQQLVLNVDGTFVLNRAEHLDMSAKAVKVQTGSLIFEGNGMVTNLGADDAGISLNLKSGDFSLEKLQPVLQFFKVSKIPLEAVDVDRLSINAKAPVNSLSQIEKLKKKMTGHVELKLRNAILKMEDRYSIEALEGEGIWDHGTLTHEFTGTAFGSDFSLNGKFPLSGPGKDATSRIKWTNLDLTKLPLKKDMAWSPTQGMVSGNLSLTGPLSTETAKIGLEFQATDLVLKPADTSKAPIALARLEGRGDFYQGQLQHDIQGTLWGSDFDIKGKLGLNPQVLNSQINWSGLDVAQLPLPSDAGWRPAEGKVSGTLTLAGPVPAEGEKFPGQLKGSLKFDAQNLKLKNADAPPLSFNQLEGEGSLNNNKVNYKLKADAFNGTFLSNGNITLPTGKSTAPILNNKIELTNLDMSQLPLVTKPEKGTVSGTIKLKGPLPDAENLLTGDLNIETDFKVTDLGMPAGNLPLNIRHLEGTASLKQGQLTHDLSGNLFGGTVKAKGKLAFHKDFPTTADSALALDHVSLNWVPLVFKNGPSAGTLTGNLQIKGPLPADGKISPDLKLKGTFAGEKLVLEKNQFENIKLDLNSSTVTQAKVVMEGIKLEDRAFKKAMGLFKITEKNINLTGGKVWPMNGLLQLAGDFKPESGHYRVKFKGEKLKVEELLSPHLIGPLQFSGALTGALPQNNDAPGLPDYARDLSGKIKIKLVDGSIPELGAVEGLLTLLNPTTALNAQKAGLSYDYLGGDFKIVKGVVHTDNFEMKSPQVNMNVVGKANLVEDSVLAQVKAMPLQMLDKVIKAIPLLGQILGGGKKGGVIETYFKVDGKLSKPDFMLLPHKSLLEKPGSILKGILNLPGNLSGGE